MSGELELQEVGSDVLLPVKAQPGARKNELRGVSAGRLKVCVTQVAEKGKANKAIVKLLSKMLGVSASRISLVQGELTSLKVFRVAGVNAAELSDRLR